MGAVCALFHTLWAQQLCTHSANIPLCQASTRPSCLMTYVFIDS